MAGKGRGPGAPDDRVRRAIAAVRAGRPTADELFDRCLPPPLREVSGHYWTPVPVVRLAAAWLREIRARSVVDMGSGAGKFPVVLALLTRCRVVGVEHRAGLVAAARDLARLFGVERRVRFVHQDMSEAGDLEAEVYYFFNPFGEYVFDALPGAEADPASSLENCRRDLEAVGALLARTPAGTFVLTYNGIGGRLPACFEQIDVARRLPGTLRLWKRQATGQDGPCR